MTTDWAKLRRIMYEPSTVWLATDYGGQRWLTDQFVLYDVTGYAELHDYDFHVCLGYPAHLGYEPLEGECSCPDEIPDGSYQLTVTKGFKPRDSVPQPDIEAYFVKMNESVWVPADPCEWSVAEHPGKAMLWTANSNIPCLLGESTWTEIKRYHPDVEVEWAPNQGAGTFRFSETYHVDPDDEECSTGECDCETRWFAFAAGIRVPDGQEHVAGAIVAVAGGRGYYPMVDATSEEDVGDGEAA